MAYVLLVFMAGANFSTSLAMQEFTSAQSCEAALVKVKATSGNVRDAVCVPK